MQNAIFFRSHLKGIDILLCEFDVPREDLAEQTIYYFYAMTKTNSAIEYGMNLDFLKNFQNLSGMILIWNYCFYHLQEKQK